ncbi:NAD(P)/FAD-dependent oxidoreductase [Citricoccus parietis]|uniref:NAD(P)/FAD-dependent oxidoreductase n=1 Tax=Citricoccus parietis TaxID=592307 RepID=A0ABV5G375_9MICC
MQTAVRLRELDWSGRVVLIDPDIGTPYERPPLSKELLKLDTTEEVIPLRKDTFYEGQAIERISGTVSAIDAVNHAVELADGTRLDYTTLMLAPGSQARKLTCPGSDLPGVLSLKTREDARGIKAVLTRGARIAIVGAGYIGLEVAAAAAAAGCETTILEFQDRVMSRVTSEPVSRFFEGLHAEQGTSLVFGAAVTEITGDGKVEGVVTADGQTYAADAVVVGIGVVPMHALATEAGLKAEDGIIVDADSRTSDPDIYAAGDATRLVWPEAGINRRLESIQSAVAQAVNAANHIMGVTTTKREVPWFWTVQHGVRLQTAGLRTPEDDIVVRGDAQTAPFSVLYLRDGKLAAIDTIGSLKDFTAGKKLIAAAAAIDQDAARDMNIKLSEAVRELASEAQ